MRLRKALFSILWTAAMSVPVGSALAAYIDVTAFDATLNTASGTLNSANVSLVTTVAPPSAFDPNGGVFSAITNGTFTGYSNAAFFTPSIATTDVITVSSSSSFSFLFSQPITNPTLQLYQLANTTLTFNAPFTLLSSDGDFTVPLANSIRGAATADDDANGSLLFSGTFTQISWTASNANTGDGVGLQISATPSVISEPGSLALLGIALTAFGLVSRRRKS